MSISRRKLGEVLVEVGLVSKKKLTEAIKAQKNSGKRLGQILVELNFISEEEMASTLAIQLKIPYIDLNDYPIQDNVWGMMPEEVSYQFVCIPTDVKDKILNVAMTDPLDLNIIKDLQFLTGYDIQPLISTRSQILDKLQKHYHPEKIINEVVQEIDTKDIFELLPEREVQEEEPEIEEIHDSPLVKMVDLIIKNAINRGCSDIHIEAQENQVKVRNRVDGVLQDSINLPKWTHPIILSRIKVLGGMDISKKRIPQDGRIKVRLQNSSVDLRISTLPTYFGEKVVIRVLNSQEGYLSVSQLGFSQKNTQTIQKLINQPQGMILITGPTGSGKTSTLYSCIHDIKSEEVNILTVEDPVEYEMEGINQIQINEKVGLTFPFVLRAILRQDPNVIMIGEIRDVASAEIALQASMTGHLVLSTLHTNDAPSSISRLVDIGIPPYLIASSLMGIVTQRLVRKICTHCKEEYVPGTDLLVRMSLSSDDLPFKFYHGAGCSECSNSGYKGRTALEEVLVMGYKIRELIQSNASTDILRIDS